MGKRRPWEPYILAHLKIRCTPKSGGLSYFFDIAIIQGISHVQSHQYWGKKVSRCDSISNEKKPANISNEKKPTKKKYIKKVEKKTLEFRMKGNIGIQPNNPGPKVNLQQMMPP